MVRYTVLMLRNGVKQSQATRSDTREVTIINVQSKTEAKKVANRKYLYWKAISCKKANILDPDARR